MTTINMNAPSSFDAATITIEAAVAATVALLMMVAVYREKENNETEIIFNDVIGKCHKCFKMSLLFRSSLILSNEGNEPTLMLRY